MLDPKAIKLSSNIIVPMNQCQGFQEQTIGHVYSRLDCSLISELNGKWDMRSDDHECVSLQRSVKFKGCSQLVCLIVTILW